MIGKNGKNPFDTIRNNTYIYHITKKQLQKWHNQKKDKSQHNHN